MKKPIKIIGIVLLALIIAVSCLAFWQKENIESIITSTKYTKEELAEKIDNNKKESEQMVESYTGGIIRDFSNEEEEQIRRGEITIDQAIAKILSESKIKTNVPNSINPSSINSSDSDDSNYSANENKDVNTITSEHITKMYMLKAEFIGKLGDLERRATADYKALPVEKRNSSGQQEIVSKYLGEATSLEGSCDKKVNDVLSSLSKGLKAANGDLQIVKTLRKAYEDEKILKKSYYLSSYK